MEIACLSDPHLAVKSPKNRIDDYPQTQFNKFSRVIADCRRYDRPLLITGDLFDTAQTPYWMTRYYIEMLKEAEVEILAVTGQHDLRYHNKKEYNNTPFAMMETAGVLSRLDSDPSIMEVEGETIHIYGAGWEEEIPTILDKRTVNILVIHKMISNTAVPYEYSDAMRFLKSTGFHIILSGDNHKGFFVEYKGRLLINPGSMMRMTSEQINHESAYVVIDTYSQTFKRVRIPMEPAKDVFDFDNIKEEKHKKRNINLEEFVSQLNIKEDGNSPNFLHILSKTVKQAKVNKGTQTFIDELIQEVME